MADAPVITRSLDRAIDLLEILALEGPCALHRVAALSGLPKSTAKRLLETLCRRNLIRRGLSDGHYRINVTIPQPGDATHAGRVAQLVTVAAEPIIGLTEAIGWPVDLHIFHRDRMQIIETTHALSPFDPGKPHIYDVELNLFAAASGIAYLSTCSDREIAQMIAVEASDERFALRRYRIAATRVWAEIAEVRRTGFARRLVGQTGATGFHAIATPVLAGRRGIGAISVWWPKAYLAPDRFVARHGAAIAATAQCITAAMTAGGDQATARPPAR